MPLAEAARAASATSSRERFGSVVPVDDPFVARNEADWRDGALVYVPAARASSSRSSCRCVHDGDGAALDWRTLIVLEEGAEAEVWERYRSASDEGEGLFNGVVEIWSAPAPTLRYVCEQELSERTWVFATQRAELERDASLEWVALGFGSARGKVRMETKLAGPGSSAQGHRRLRGAGRQHLDFDTTQEHAAAHTTSDLAFRGVLADRATAVWRGHDPRRPRRPADRRLPGEPQPAALEARPTPTRSRASRSRPNDVRCTHAAAVAQVDPEQLYYLRSRGLPEPQAKRLIIDGLPAGARRADGRGAAPRSPLRGAGQAPRRDPRRLTSRAGAAWHREPAVGNP